MIFYSQSFRGHHAVVERIKKTLYYGEIDEAKEVTECPSLPLTETVVDLMENVMKLKYERKRKIDVFDLQFASTVSDKACISPCSVVLSVIYIERLKRKNPEYLRTVSPCDLFLVSMVSPIATRVCAQTLVLLTFLPSLISALQLVASKYLFDDGEDEEVFNDEWAASASLQVKELNKKEREFLNAIDWHLFVTPDEFFSQLTLLEIMVTWKQTRKRSRSRTGLTYNELVSLAFNGSSLKAWVQFSDSVMKGLAVTFVTYSAIVLSVCGATVLACTLQMMIQQALIATESCKTALNTTTAGTVAHMTSMHAFVSQPAAAADNASDQSFTLGESGADHGMPLQTQAKNTCNGTTSSSNVYLIFSTLLRMRTESANRQINATRSSRMNDYSHRVS